MNLKNIRNRTLLIYIAKFLAIFCLAYYGTKAVEGLATPENYYSPFIDHHFDYPTWLRNSLLAGTKFLVSLFGYQSYIPDHYHVRMVNGRGVQLIYACLGVGVTCFWLAFVMANKGKWMKKLIWIIGGALCIWIINVTRISLVLVFTNTNRHLPFDIDNHDFFNVLSYVALFLMIFLYDRSFGKVDKADKIDGVDKGGSV